MGSLHRLHKSTLDNYILQTLHIIYQSIWTNLLIQHIKASSKTLRIKTKSFTQPASLSLELICCNIRLCVFLCLVVCPHCVENILLAKDPIPKIEKLR